MKKLEWVLIICFLACLSSCSKGGSGSGGTTPPPNNSIPVTGITVNLSSINLLVNATQQLTVTVAPSNATNKTINWNSSNSSVATVDANGLVKAIAAGTATITARSADNSNITATALVNALANYDVYVAGFGSTTSGRRALYWKNGTPTVLTGGSKWSHNASGITVSGNDIYVAGATLSTNNWQVASYWKNNVLIQMSPLSNDFNHYTQSIAVSGNDAYISSYSFFDTGCPSCQYVWNACYYKITGTTATKVPLIVSGFSTDAFGLAVSGSDVYVAGSQHNNFYSTPKIWKNDVNNAVSLNGGVSWGKATAITVAGADVYAAGFDQCPNVGCIKTLKLWKNDMNNVVSLTGGTSDADANAVAASGTTVYVAGYEKNGAGKQVAKYWKVNGTTVTAYPLSDGSTDAIIYSIYIIGDDIFFAGYLIDPTFGNKKATVWRVNSNAVVQTITLIPPFGSTDDAAANSIFVK